MTTSTSTRFNSPKADIILRTSDGVDLRLCSCILAEASPFFADMLSLPQPANVVDKDSIPIVDISELAEVMETLMLFVYPRPDPQLQDLALLEQVLGAALKYDFEEAIIRLRSLLVSPLFLEKEPIRVYAIACMHDLEEEAKIASSHTLNVNLLDGHFPSELRHITAQDYYKLLHLHRTRAEAAQALLVRPDSVRCSNCSALNYGKECVPKWWDDFETRARAELKRNPVTDIVFSMSFLSTSAAAGCPRCGSSILASHGALMELKAAIDAVPSTI